MQFPVQSGFNKDITIHIDASRCTPLSLSADCYTDCTNVCNNIVRASQLYVDSLYDLRTEQDGQAKV